MPRYATIEHNSGLVWWVGDAPDPLSAVMASDAVDPSSVGERRYVETFSRIADSDGGFDVHEVPAGFDATANDYDAVERHPKVAMFKATPIRESDR